MKDFVTFELAKKLKEKGYPQGKESTLAMYNEDGEFHSLCQTIGDFEYLFEDFDENDYVCPTISQVLRWLREYHDIDVIALPCFYKDGKYSAALYFEKMILTKSFFTKFSGTREEATMFGIEYVVDNVLKKGGVIR